MKTLCIVLISLIVLTGCGTTHFEQHKGLIFKEIDWSQKLERPFVINAAILPELGDRKVKVYFPAKLFKDVTIVSVYYDNMKCEDIQFVVGEKERYLVFFDKDLHEHKKIPFRLDPDQAIIEINIKGKFKTVKIEDMRVPFYRKKGVTSN
jgi:hypothetical protein